VTDSPTAQATRARLVIVLAALLWSTSGAFTNVLREPTVLGLHEPALHPLQIATGRVLFAGLALVPLLRWRDVSFSPLLAGTAISFALMNASFITAMALGTAASAILLQNTAPLWLYLAARFGLGGTAGQRGAIAMGIGMLGIACIVYGGWQEGQLAIVALGLFSGFTYALILLGLRLQRDASAVWLTVVNHLFAALALLPFVWSMGLPTSGQIAWLFVFGACQLGLPYLLMARSLKHVSPQEASLLTLLEPLLNPLWAYLIAPQKETPTVYLLLGGSCILLALVYRYWPARLEPASTGEP